MEDKVGTNTDAFLSMSDPYENSTATSADIFNNSIRDFFNDDHNMHLNESKKTNENNTSSPCSSANTNATDGLNVSTDELNVSTDRLNVSTDGLNISTDGLNISTDGLNISTDGLNVTTDGLNVSTSDEINNIHTKTNETIAEEHTIDDYLVYLIFKWAFKITMPVCLIIGIPGNILNIIILCRYISDSTSSMHIILISLAVSDIICLAVGTPRFIISYATGYDYAANSDIGCKIYRFLNFVFSDFSSWLVMLISLERLVAVVWPCHVKSWCSHKTIKITIAVFLVFLMGINFHVLLSHGIVSQLKHEDTQTFDCIVKEPEFAHYGFVIFPWIDFAVFALIPSCVVILSNTIIIRKVTIAAFKRRNTMAVILADKSNPASSKQQPLIRRMTIMMFSICGLMLLCVTPTVIYGFMFKSLTQNGDLKSSVIIAVLGYYGIIAFYFNCTINFLLYICCSQRFKIVLRSFFCGGTTANDSVTTSKL
ncbi:unnamed protein product [Owenia fusiformis]|uniref:Uncharacterized protein n=1 Tax=Owenia fusiformis TaxID=6347 RepID=A0A8J1U5M7_OWEFU|nr:unnamed protein product [Owenia fusiformis]